MIHPQQGEIKGLLPFCSHHLLVLVTLAALGGATTAGWLEESAAGICTPSVFLPLLLFCAFTALLIPARARPLTCLPFFFLLALVHTHLAFSPPTAPGHIVHQVTQKTRATVVGTILNMPEYNGKMTKFILDCDGLLKADSSGSKGFQGVHGRLQVSLEDPPPPFLRPGNTLMFIATLDRLHKYQTPGAIDFPMVLAGKKIYCSAWVQSGSAVEPVHFQEKKSFLNKLGQEVRFFPEQVRQQTGEFLQNSLPAERASLYQALLIGSLVNISPDTLEIFKASGVFHILAISGLHFSLLGLFTLGVWLFILKRSQWLLVHMHVPSLALLMTSPILLLYAFVAGLNLPAVRALTTALLVLLAILVRRQRSFLPLIAAAALFIFTINPLAVFTPSFQLSFAAVLAINFIYPRLPVFDLPAEARAGWPSLLDRAWKAVQSMFLVSLAATAGTLPILLFHFNRVSLIGPVMNLVIEPLLCLWALPWGLIAFSLFGFAPDLAAGCLQIGDLGLRLSLWFIKTIQTLPHLSLWTITPSIAEIGIYYCLLWLVVHRPAFAYRSLLATTLSLILTASFTRSLWFSWPTDQLTIHFLDVGQGTSTLVQLPQGKNILIDGGGYESERFNVGSSLIAPFLWHQRIWRLDQVVITHPHGDHYNGMPFILDRFKPQQIVINGDEGTEAGYAQLLSKAHEQKAPLHAIKAGTPLLQSEQTQLQCLGMPGLSELPGWTTNDRSLVLSLRYKDQTFLFPADIGRNSEQVLLDRGADVNATVLLAPHHGSRGSSSQAFIKAVDPSLIVVSAGRNRQGVLPAPEHLDAWRKQKIRTLITAEDGTITLTADAKGLRANTFSGKKMQLSAQSRVSAKKKMDLKGKINRAMLGN